MACVVGCENELGPEDAEEGTAGTVPTTAKEDEHGSEEEGTAGGFPEVCRVITVVETFGVDSLAEQFVLMDDFTLRVWVE